MANEGPARSTLWTAYACREQLPEAFPRHAESPAEDEDRKALTATGGSPHSSQLVGLTSADAEYGRCLLDGQGIGKLVERGPAPSGCLIPLTLRLPLTLRHA